MHKKYMYPALALLFVLSIFGSLLVVNVLKPGNPGFNGFETAINPSTAGSLKQLWSISEGSINVSWIPLANSKRGDTIRGNEGKGPAIERQKAPLQVV